MIKSRRMIWAGHVARMWSWGFHIGYWCQIKKERDQLGKSRLKWVHNIKIERSYMDWIDMAQDRDRWRALVNTEMNLRVP
jgi:hypothetical protein